MKSHDSGLSPDMVPDTKVSVREIFGLDQDLRVPGVSRTHRVRAGHRSGVSLQSGNDAVDSGGLCVQSPRDDSGLSRHRQVDAHRAGRGAAELAVHPRQPRQPHQPDRPRRQRRDRRAGRPADHRIQRRHAAVGAAAPDGARVRRIRRGPARRDVRDPARARSRGQTDVARSEQGHQPASGVPAVLDDEHDRPRRHDRPVSRHAADQPGSDGPLEHRDDAELSAARRRSRNRAQQGAELEDRTRVAGRSRTWCRLPI